LKRSETRRGTTPGARRINGIRTVVDSRAAGGHRRLTLGWPPITENSQVWSRMTYSSPTSTGERDSVDTCYDAEGGERPLDEPPARRHEVGPVPRERSAAAAGLRLLPGRALPAGSREHDQKLVIWLRVRHKVGPPNGDEAADRSCRRNEAAFFIREPDRATRASGP